MTIKPCPFYGGEAEKEEEKIVRALGMIYRYGGIDGSHHKQWVIDQIVRILTGDGYAEWVACYNRSEGSAFEYQWDEGIAP
jgi:hypothetical protein